MYETLVVTSAGMVTAYNNIYISTTVHNVTQSTEQYRDQRGMMHCAQITQNKIKVVKSYDRIKLTFLLWLAHRSEHRLCPFPRSIDLFPCILSAFFSFCTFFFSLSLTGPSNIYFLMFDFFTSFVILI